MEYLSDWRFVIGGCIAGFVIGMSRGGFAGGVHFVGVLIMAQIIEPTIAAAFILPILCCADVLGNVFYRKEVHWPSVKILVPGGMLGLAIGAAIFYLIHSDVIKLIVCVLSLYIVADRFIRHRLSSAPRTLPRLVGYGLGVMTGISSFIIHAGYLPVSAYLLPQQLSRFMLIGTFAAMGLFFNFVKLVPYTGLGLLDWSVFGASVVFMPLCVVGFLCGKMLVPHMSDRLFYRLVYGVVLVLGIRLGIEGVLGLLSN